MANLKHSGIKGQKWGVRRFQNEDGSLTEEGKARYYDRYGFETPTAPNHRPVKKTVSEMTDEELDANIKRLEKENQYHKLNNFDSDEQYRKEMNDVARETKYRQMDEDEYEGMSKKTNDTLTKINTAIAIVGGAAGAITAVIKIFEKKSNKQTP